MIYWRQETKGSQTIRARTNTPVIFNARSWATTACGFKLEFSCGRLQPWHDFTAFEDWSYFAFMGLCASDMLLWSLCLKFQRRHTRHGERLTSNTSRAITLHYWMGISSLAFNFREKWSVGAHRELLEEFFACCGRSCRYHLFFSWRMLGTN